MNIDANIKEIYKQIEKTVRKIGRTSNEITVMAVTKTRSISEIEETLRCGLLTIGENRIQEAETKIPFLKIKPLNFILSDICRVIKYPS